MVVERFIKKMLTHDKNVIFNAAKSILIYICYNFYYEV